MKDCIYGKRRKIVFYGDSNTYGYDPADSTEGRFPRDIRWTGRLEAALADEFEIIAEGLNGRTLPRPLFLPEDTLLSRLTGILGEGDIFAFMLGTNDLLRTMPPNVDKPVKWLEKFLDYLTERKRPEDILVIAPPCSGSGEAGDRMLNMYYEACLKMNAAFARTAARYQTRFADAQAWGVRVGPDFVHISEEGHLTFARKMEEYLRAILLEKPID